MAGNSTIRWAIGRGSCARERPRQSKVFLLGKLYWIDSSRVAVVWRVLLAAIVALAITGCGGTDQESTGGSGPTASEIAACLEKGGATDVESREEDEVGEYVLGATDGGNIFIVNLLEPGLNELALELIRKKKREAGVRSILIAKTLNDGFTLVGVIGHTNVEAGVPSRESELLARQCATRPTV